ncbi:DUF305 domain-containing protein [Allopusillimonas ginsengisoli]|uniref:DUF305 domain-containing protein n=1 Tax=Allopusillimonas ginsengisoli TaxID=453575 RepID=UPI00102049C4|nr:DUF305 domain-containing protein [Allopusillimonas ginsengisoli]TEA77191.1 DUF305 domain-containing protein [Allopusillimonas ginsengisoli]
MQIKKSSLFHHASRQLGVILFLCLAGASANAHQGHQHGQAASDASPPPVFVASTSKSFAALMDDAMAVMDDGMLRAPMNGQANHDFITMMLPHHQGAVDMAKAVLLYTEDPEIRNLALGIIAEQQTDIQVMQAWLNHHADKSDKSDKSAK